MAVYRAKVTSKGQVTIPIEVRKRLGIKQGDELENAREDGALTICGVVYAELLTCPGMTATRLNDFLLDTGVETDFESDGRLWQRESDTRGTPNAAGVRKVDRRDAFWPIS
jgi:AbrB family looped-hinge helix DNA binding protein